MRAMGNYNAGHKAVLDDMLLGYPLVRAGKMFGYPAYYVGRKLCISLYEDGVGIKLPAATVARLLKTDPNATPFQPMGKSRMKEWVQLNARDSDEYRRYRPIFEESIQFVLSQQE